ncbi:MAG TPA: PIN domain-containing protein [Candidatus Methylomirabilis sp.]|nr:PIN domain-containing protein [Candidatus Methylomirabilis sp.]
MGACRISWDPWTAASQTSVPAITSTSSPTFASVADLLLDTGAWVALLDRREREHARCVGTLQGFTGRLISSEAVLTETLWLVSGLRDGSRRCAEFVRRGAVLLVPISPDSLGRAVDLMDQYRNVPKDCADATLVTLGEDLDLAGVFTLDRRGFGVYRLRGRRPFQIVP